MPSQTPSRRRARHEGREACEAPGRKARGSLPAGAWILAWTLMLTFRAASGAELNVAAASDLRFAMEAMAQAFRTNHPSIEVRVTYGSSGNFFAQLQNRAPFDLFFSADIEYPRRLAEAGLALEGKVFAYGVGRLVLWAPQGSTLDVEALGIRALTEASVKRVAIANPRHAPYGKAAVAAMESLNVLEAVRARLVFGENIAQAAQFVESGAADLGILAFSLAVAPEMRGRGRFWEIPRDAYPRLDQGGIILKATREAASASAFRDYVLGKEGRGILAAYGFLPPPRSASTPDR